MSEIEVVNEYDEIRNALVYHENEFSGLHSFGDGSCVMIMGGGRSERFESQSKLYHWLVCMEYLPIKQQ